MHHASGSDDDDYRVPRIFWYRPEMGIEVRGPAARATVGPGAKRRLHYTPLTNKHEYVC